MGRHARLDLAFELRGGRTVLTRSYAEPPFRIGRAFDIEGVAYLILVCAGPGVFAGDCLRQRVTVGPGARVLLTSQAALQIHPADAPSAAAVHSDYRVADDGELHCHWDPAIPFADARLLQRVDLRIARTSRLYWSDALMSGRASRGEAWQFRSVDHELRLEVDGRLSYLERYRLAPSERPVPHPWRTGLNDYIGTVLVHHEGIRPSVAEDVQRQLSAIEGVTAGVDLLEASLLVGRLLGTTGVGWSRARERLRDTVLASTFGSPSLVVRR